MMRVFETCSSIRGTQILTIVLIWLSLLAAALSAFPASSTSSSMSQTHSSSFRPPLLDPHPMNISYATRRNETVNLEFENLVETGLANILSNVPEDVGPRLKMLHMSVKEQSPLLIPVFGPLTALQIVTVDDTTRAIYSIFRNSEHWQTVRTRPSRSVERDPLRWWRRPGPSGVERMLMTDALEYARLAGTTDLFSKMDVYVPPSDPFEPSVQPAWEVMWIFRSSGTEWATVVGTHTKRVGRFKFHVVADQNNDNDNGDDGSISRF